MAMKKVEMEEHNRQYLRAVQEVSSMVREGCVRDAIDRAKASWQHIDGMLQFEKKYAEGDRTTVKTIDICMAYAPMLFDSQTLDEVGSLLKDCRRIEKNTSVDLSDTLSESKEIMWIAHRLWEQMEQSGNVDPETLTKTLGVKKKRWARIIDAWEKMGLVRRFVTDGHDFLALATQLGEVVPGKCPQCGERAQAPKAMFFEELTCSSCDNKDLFVILASEAETDSEG